MAWGAPVAGTCHCVSSLAVQHLTPLPTGKNHPLHIDLVGCSVPCLCDAQLGGLPCLLGEPPGVTQGEQLGLPAWDVTLEPVTQK